MKNILSILALIISFGSFGQNNEQYFESGDFENFLKENIRLINNNKESEITLPPRFNIGVPGVMQTTFNGVKWSFSASEFEGKKIRDTIIIFKKSGESVKSEIFEYNYFISSKKFQISVSKEVWESRYFNPNSAKIKTLKYNKKLKFQFSDKHHYTVLEFSDSESTQDLLFKDKNGFKVDNLNINKFFKNSITKPNLKSLSEVKKYVKYIYENYVKIINNKHIGVDIVCDSCIL